MNCQEFEGSLLDLVCGRAQEESARMALSHAGVCARCAARLADERALAGGLRALARNPLRETPPTHVEAALLKRFRELGQSKVAAQVPLPEIHSVKVARWQTPAYVGLAASVLLLLGWMLIRSPREADEAQVTPAPKPIVAAGDKPVSSREVAPAAPSEPARKPIRQSKTRPLRVSAPVPEARVHYAAGPSRQSENPLRDTESALDNGVETEFLPFMAAGPLFPAEQQQFVRVKLPRSALQVFGLPMNMERAREPVQADVLLGEDGRALAVRFVRE
ncbi:MAG: hypothetical protein L0387_32775 [Acidobacteria bacterium]|nr:hypothetical protein [Acidobacteriota bacterium]MCI0720698.1 hypothetical protein [Acidobacteriota bacterium]